MHTRIENLDVTLIAHLNHFLRRETSAVEMYHQAIRQLPDGPTEELVANRDCHQKRVALLRKTIAKKNGIPDAAVPNVDDMTSVDQRGRMPTSAKQVIASLEEREDRGVHDYRFPGSLDPQTTLLVENVLLPRQLETHERMQIRKSRMV